MNGINEHSGEESCRFCPVSIIYLFVLDYILLFIYGTTKEEPSYHGSIWEFLVCGKGWENSSFENLIQIIKNNCAAEGFNPKKIT